MRTAVVIRSVLFSLLLLVISGSAFGQIGIGISVGFAPPAIPVYEQPICPGDGYLWTPGFWDYADDDYYWVPGTWIEPPQVGFLWTPGYWGWGGSAFLFHAGYWGPHVGFYGGINYGFGYGGRGYEGGRWNGGHFFYNTNVNHINVTVIHNTYNKRVVVNNTRISYNGGSGGVNARATSKEEKYGSEQHVGRVAAQEQHVQQARSNPDLRASANHGKPPIAATSRPGDFKNEAVGAREAGGEYKAPERGNAAAAPAAHSNPGHANEIDAHKSTPPNTGNANQDKKYQQEQDKLAAKQNQEHQKLQQQQDKEHQQATKKNFNDGQRQQMEQRHTQQTQQMEQRHTQETQHVQERQAPRPSGGRH
jgi:hypothetical protein